MTNTNETKKADPFKDPNLKATPQGMSNERFIEYITERARRDPRYARGGSRWKERGE